MSTVTLHIGDVFDQLAKIPDGSIDLIVTSPPFLALRSYLPEDHPDKALEIGSESGPAAFLDTMMALTAEWGRVLAPHGSLCVELGDTYSGAGGYGSADSPNPAYGKASHNARFEGRSRKRFKRKDDGWPEAKSKTMLDTLYPACLAYGRNLLDVDAVPFDPWRIRNLIVWARPNPPVGALGDKFRPATSYITVACKSPRRWFDLDAVRGPSVEPSLTRVGAASTGKGIDGGDSGNPDKLRPTANPAGAPPLDWHADDHPEDGDWLWKMSPQGFAGSHYATFPMALPTRLIKAMCPERVCTVCGAPSERITDRSYIGAKSAKPYEPHVWASGIADGKGGHSNKAPDEGARVIAETVGWTDCECPDDGDTMDDPSYSKWRTGRVLDPFAGSGTTLVAAHNESRDAIGIDLDDRNVAMVEDRLGPLVAACDLTVNTAQEAAA